MLGYPRAALADAEHALSYARQIGQDATLMSALGEAIFTFAMCGNYAVAQALLNDLASLSNEKGASFWKATAILGQADRLAGTGKTTEAAQMLVFRNCCASLDWNDTVHSVVSVGLNKGLCKTW